MIFALQKTEQELTGEYYEASSEYMKEDLSLDRWNDQMKLDTVPYQRFHCDMWVWLLMGCVKKTYHLPQTFSFQTLEGQTLGMSTTNPNFRLPSPASPK